MTPISSTYLDYLNMVIGVIFENESNIIQLLKKWTPLISGQIYLHQQCPLIGERPVVYSSLISCGTHVSAWHITCISVSNRLRFATFFTLILSFENGIGNEWTSLLSKNHHLFDKNSQMTNDVITKSTIYKINKILHERLFANVLPNCWCSQRCS